MRWVLKVGTLGVSLVMGASLAAWNTARSPAPTQDYSRVTSEVRKIPAAPVQQLFPAQTPAQATVTINGESGPLPATLPRVGFTLCRPAGQEYEPMDERMPCGPDPAKTSAPALVHATNQLKTVRKHNRARPPVP